MQKIERFTAFRKERKCYPHVRVFICDCGISVISLLDRLDVRKQRSCK